MKNLIFNKLERFNYLSITSTLDKLAKDYCLNITVELADLNSMIPSDKRKNVLIITNDVNQYESRIITLQSKFFPESHLKQNVSIMSHNPFMDYTNGDPCFYFKKLSEVIVKNQIQCVYVDGWELSGEELEELIKFLKLMKIYFIHYLEDCAEDEYFDDSSIIINSLESNKCLIRYLDVSKEIVSKTVLIEKFRGL